MTQRIRPATVLAGLAIVGAAGGHVAWGLGVLTGWIPWTIWRSPLGAVHFLPMVVAAVAIVAVRPSRLRVPLTGLGAAVMLLPLASPAIARAVFDWGCGCSGCSVPVARVAAGGLATWGLVVVGALAAPRHPRIAAAVALPAVWAASLVVG